ncbi:MAG: 50S ribosomal protein L11 methyltransferase [Armatimonadetes bacterium]|nr:50S ribosomal protein L11 methyltransferase [Armatimonadota bacterium]
MRWAAIEIKAPSDSIEAVIGILLDIGISGIEQIDGKPARLIGYHPVGDTLEPLLDKLQLRLSRLQALDIPAVGEITLRIVEEADWESAWKRYFKPLEIGQRLVILPTWERYPNPDHRLVVRLDPGMAFGTGGHPTTRLCLVALEKWAKEGDLAVDIGTGSGILALAAARLGARQVYATDIDTLPREVAAKNVILNELVRQVTVFKPEDLQQRLADDYPRRPDLVIANIIADTIIELAPIVYQTLRTGGIFIASGIVEEREPDVIRCLSDAGYELVEKMDDEMWRLLVCCKAL